MKVFALSLISSALVSSIAFADAGRLEAALYPPPPGPGPSSAIKVFMETSSTKSCLARAGAQNAPDDIAANYFQITPFTIYWGNVNEDLYVSEIRIEFRHPLLKDGEYKTNISGPELASMSGFEGGWNGWIPRAYPGTSSRFDAYCGPIAGNIELNNPGNKPFMASGFITVFGYRRDFRGYEVPVNFGGALNIVYRP